MRTLRNLDIYPLGRHSWQPIHSGNYGMRIILAISQGDIKLQAALLTAGTL